MQRLQEELFRPRGPWIPHGKVLIPSLSQFLNMKSLCPSSTILDNFSPGAISKPSLNEEHHFVESRKGDSAIFDKFFMRKTYIEKSPKAQTKSLIFSEQSPFGNSPDKTEGSIDRSPKVSLGKEVVLT